MLLPSIAEAQYTPRDCCDIAAELIAARDEFDLLDEQIDECEDTIALGLMFQQQILMRNPFTPEDQQAWDNISRVILKVNDQKIQLQAQQDALAERIIALNQELSMCVPIPDNGGPILPMPDPLMP